jgi:signal transduction histidine kinase
VELDVDIEPRLSEPIEVAAYYIVSAAHVEARTRDGGLHISVRDDGVGGADPIKGG